MSTSTDSSDTKTTELTELKVIDLVKKKPSPILDFNPDISQYIKLNEATCKIIWAPEDEAYIKVWINRILFYKILYDKMAHHYHFRYNLLAHPIIFLSGLSLAFQTITTSLSNNSSNSNSANFALVVLFITALITLLTYVQSKLDYWSSYDSCLNASLKMAKLAEILDTTMSLSKSERQPPYIVKHGAYADCGKIRDEYKKVFIPTKVWKQMGDATVKLNMDSFLTMSHPNFDFDKDQEQLCTLHPATTSILDKFSQRVTSQPN